MQSQTEKNSTGNRKIQCITLSNFVHKKLTNHIRILKNLENRSTTSQSWLSKAIENKIEKNKKDFPEKVPINKNITVKIEQKTLTELERQVEFIKRFNTSYSKTKWISEAILEQLEEESEKIQNLFKDS